MNERLNGRIRGVLTFASGGLLAALTTLSVTAYRAGAQVEFMRAHVRDEQAHLSAMEAEALARLPVEIQQLRRQLDRLEGLLHDLARNHARAQQRRD